MNENEEEKVLVRFNIGSNVPVKIPKFTTAKSLVGICSEQFQIDRQKYHIDLTRNGISLTSGDNGQVLEFAHWELINVSVKARRIGVKFIFPNGQKASLEIENGSSVEEIVQALRKQCGIPNNYVIHLIKDSRVLDNKNYLFTEGETIFVFREDKNKSGINWKFIFSGSPFLVLTLLALILQWHITFVIIFLIVSLVLALIGLWPKVKTCCPRKILSSYEPENPDLGEENIPQNLNLDQDYQQDLNINFE